MRRATLHCNTPNVLRHYFYPRSPCGERPSIRIASNFQNAFLSTLSLRRATINSRTYHIKRDISIHALLAESDSMAAICQTVSAISIHALLAESDLRVLDGSKSSIEISIHALLAESDHNTKNNYTDYCDFYPRSPCGERPFAMTTTICTASFLSTLSLRRATSPASITPTASRNFYPRSPCGERQPGERHANSQQEFLSTLSLRRATERDGQH